MSVILLFAVACGSTTPKTTETAPADTQPAATDSAPPQDTTPPEDSTPPQDTTPPEDTFPPEDTSPPEDTAVPETTHPTIPPDWPDYSEGLCPTLIGSNVSDLAVNDGFLSSGNERSFRLMVPSHYDGSHPLPLVIGWHWMNASSSSFVRDGELERAVEEMDFIALFPDDIEDAYFFNWPFVETWGVEQELLFFNDLLACVSGQYNIDPYQVHGVGVSAGALWLTYISTTEEVTPFASVMSLSGGLGEVLGVWEMEYVPQERKFPALVLNGGPTDWLAVDFHAASERFIDELRADDHFVVGCEHDQGHAVPPFEPPEGETLFFGMWSFMFDHPYDLDAGVSPYQADGVLPSYLPEWCWIAP